MSHLAFVSILFGTIIIITRAPIILAPEASKVFLLKSIFPSKNKIRIMGVFAVTLGTVMIFVAQGDDQLAALIVKYFGWFTAIFAGSVFLFFTSTAKDIFINVLENMDELIFRIIGVIGTGLGAFFIYLGCFIL